MILCWRKLVEDVNRDPWELGYKIVTKKLGAQKPEVVMDLASMETIAGTFFPTHPIRKDRSIEDVGKFPLFNEEELRRAVQSLQNKKAF